MTSGVKVADSVKTLYNEMKVVKSDADQDERKRLVTFDIVNNQIVETNIYKEKDLTGQDVFMFFKGLLKQGECHYILYDCHYANNESSKKEELILVTWCCENASIKCKMGYASSKDAIVKIFTGIKHNWQFNDLGDCGDRRNFAEKLGNVTTLEGLPLCS